MTTTCGSCLGSGKVSCSSCCGRGYISRLTLHGDMETNPCLVCYGRRHVPCSFCQGRGQLDSPTDDTPQPAGPKPPPYADALAGIWNTANGSYEFIKDQNGYRVIETGALGQSAEGRATLQGNLVILAMRSVFLGDFTLQLHLADNRLEGTLLLLGVPVPFILSRR